MKSKRSKNSHGSRNCRPGCVSLEMADNVKNADAYEIAGDIRSVATMLPAMDLFTLSRVDIHWDSTQQLCKGDMEDFARLIRMMARGGESWELVKSGEENHITFANFSLEEIVARELSEVIS